MSRRRWTNEKVSAAYQGILPSAQQDLPDPARCHAVQAVLLSRLLFRQQGILLAQHGNIYCFGQGVPQYLEVGIEWLKASASHGNEPASALLEKVQTHVNQQTSSAVFGLFRGLAGMIQSSANQHIRRRNSINRKQRQKIDEKNRTVSISAQAIEVLREQKRKTNDQYVFPSPNGGPIFPDSVNNMLRRVLERAGIPKVRFHDLRHTLESDGTSRQFGLRPVVLVSNNLANRHSPVVVIVSLSSQIYKKKKLPVHCLLKTSEAGLKCDSLALCKQPDCPNMSAILTKTVCPVSMIASEYSCASEPM